VIALSATGSTDFYPPILEDYHPPRYPQLRKTGAVLERLARTHIVLLGGDPTINLLPLARQLAWFTSRQLARTRSDGQHTQLPTQEWMGSGSQNIEQVLQQFDDDTIFILPRLLPRHFHHDWRQLYQLIRSRFYVIATIEEETPWRQLMEPKAFSYFWEELNISELYPQQDMIEFFKDRLVAEEKTLAGVSARDVYLDRATLGGMTPEQIVKQLQQPENIYDFVLQLCEESQHGALTDEVVVTCLRAAHDDSGRLRQWYSHLTDVRNRLLVLALNLFDGLAEDQFYAVIDELVEQAWQRRDPTLRALDYCDFEPLRRFFDYVPRRSGETVIKTRLVNQRRLLIDIAWDSHRRHMLSALPVLYRCIIQSVNESQAPHDWQLYGGKARRDQLRKTITESISDIGLKDVRAVELWLLQFATKSNIGIQAVAARIIARWREFGKHDEAITMLHRWIGKRDLKTILDDAVPQEEEQHDKPDVTLRQTIALTIGYASQVDRPNKINPALFAMLEQLVKEDEISVLRYISSYTLPMMLALHIRKLEKIIRHLAMHEELHNQIARSFAQIYQAQHADIQRLLNQWYIWCMSPAARNLGGVQLSDRRKLLTCMCVIYGHLPYDKALSGISVREVFENLRYILKMESYIEIRKAALTAVMRQTRSSFDELQDVLSEVTPEEMSEVIDTLVDIYLEQREALQGGQTYMRARDKHYYPVWITRPRPFTQIEVEMYTWLRDNNNVIAQQIAVRALVAFNQVLANDEQRHIDRMSHPRRRRGQPILQLNRRVVTTPKVGLYPRDWYFYYIVPWVVTIGASQYRQIVRSVLPELLFQDRINKANLRDLFQDWQERRDRDIVELSHRLPRAIWWAQHPGIAVLLATVVLLIFMVTIVVF
jgi:hypothetical protein